MTAKEYLSQVGRLKIRLSATKEQAACLRAAAEYIKPQLSKLPGPASRNVHKHEDAIVRVMDTERLMGDMVKQLTEINGVIAAVEDPLLQSILVKRYIQGNGWQEIADGVNVSVSHLHRLHNKALGEIEKLRANETK